MKPVFVFLILASIAALSLAAPSLPLDDEQALLESLSTTLSLSNVNTAVADVQTSMNSQSNNDPKPKYVVVKGWRFRVVSFTGTCGSRNIMNACRAIGYEAPCDHPSYIGHGGGCINLPNFGGHWSIKAHVQRWGSNSILTDMCSHKYFFVGLNPYGQYSHWNNGNNGHEGAGINGGPTGRNPNGGETVCAKQCDSKSCGDHGDHLQPVQELLAQLRQKLLNTIANTNSDVVTKENTMKKTRRESDEKIKQAEEAAARDAGIYNDAVEVGKNGNSKARKEIEMLDQIVKAVQTLNNDKEQQQS